MDPNLLVFQPSFNDHSCTVLTEGAAPATLKLPYGFSGNLHQYRLVVQGAAAGTAVWLYGQAKVNRAVNRAGDPNYVNANPGVGPDTGFTSAATSPGPFQVAPGAPPAAPLPAAESAPTPTGTTGDNGNCVLLLTGHVETLTLKDDWYYSITSADGTATVTLNGGKGMTGGF